MSIDINDKSASIIDGDTSMTDVVLDNSINEQDLEKLKFGINSNIELQHYMTAITKCSFDNLNYFTPLLNTTNTDILNSIGKSNEFGRLLQQTLVQASNNWNQDLIKLILKVLGNIPFDLQVLLKNTLGIAVKDIKNMANERNDLEIHNTAISLMDKWKELKKTNTTNLNMNGKRDKLSTTEENNELPPAKKAIKLAIQKEPPSKPKAIINSNFFSSLIEPKKLTSTTASSSTNTTTTTTSTTSTITSTITPTPRPIYSVDRILETISKNDKSNEVNTDVDMISSTTPITTNTKPKKRVQFKDDLVEIREFTSYPGERTRFFGQEEEEEFYSKEQQQTPPPFSFMQIEWYSPFELILNTEKNSRLIISKEIHTEEANKQENREKTELAAVYTSLQHIPPSPTEPDEIPDPNPDSAVTTIPLKDISKTTDSTRIHSTATAFSQPMTIPTHTIPISSYHHNQFQLSSSSAAAAVIQQNPVNSPPLQQPDLSSGTIEAWIKNNPGILETLKQISFLADGANIAIPPEQTPMNNYQQPSLTYQSPAPSTTTIQNVCK
ncbi:uncharacterized protein BX663DRAFT_508715 [Cokeromyces recurvatus]|uniref:uncharacterized protein n=1 Tax=Cokeromyces recurvatus TaxID=90255 RepID=UPI00221FEEAC|nr:uncharacterized protein BX663DRAFT_508715 [Cokeromyces recurvatus]KAI7902874.1 hypothetical protein BX663DRAFT_508715 [Cokeromyces recurvatus]